MDVVRDTALVLGGGGITGVAWEIGMLAGLAGAGLDLTQAETVVGTSAGSVVGALVSAGTDLETMYASQLEDPSQEVGATLGLTIGLRYATYFLLPGTAQAKRARVGRAAQRTRTVHESVRRQVIRSRLGDLTWSPRRRLLVTAVDADSGELRIFDEDSGVDLATAVTSSCAVPLVWPPVSVDGRKYVDGGIRSPANADLARGARHVVVIAPITKTIAKSARVDRQLARLGPDVASVVVSPDGEAARAIGRNVLDPSRRAASARAGRAQASRVLAEVRKVWPV